MAAATASGIVKVVPVVVRPELEPACQGPRGQTGPGPIRSLLPLREKVRACPELVEGLRRSSPDPWQVLPPYIDAGRDVQSDEADGDAGGEDDVSSDRVVVEVELGVRRDVARHFDGPTHDHDLVDPLGQPWLTPNGPRDVGQRAQRDEGQLAAILPRRFYQVICRSLGLRTERGGWQARGNAAGPVEVVAVMEPARRRPRRPPVDRDFGPPQVGQ